jgi:NADH-quinone oxidoreductase subunit L
MFETVANLAWLILLLPLVAAVVITLFTQRDQRLSAGLSIGAIVISFLCGLLLLAWLPGGTSGLELKLNWLSVGTLNVEFGLRLDALSVLMLLVVTGVGSVIHIYSYGYMHGDRGFSRYFASLSLFTFSMLGIVLANNFLIMFVFWELVGLSSYLLIGFWYERGPAADASKKAFLTNRVGDFGFLTGIILVWAVLGSLNFGEIEARLRAEPGALGSVATIAGLLIFCGAVGKSAQFPLHVWLPDAMEGPTPVSALIHAATMVAAGVYMLCRVFFLYAASQAWPEWAPLWVQGITALEVIAWVGGFTALLAAVIAVQQNDIKRILAYSTLSQLGYMVMAVGLSGASPAGPSPAMFHLTTHAFFKALLFLGAGAVIHGMHHEQNIWNMGGLKEKMPLTFWTFLIGTLALSGVPPFAGFYSKDAILAVALHQSPALFILGVLVAVLTTFYMFRLLLVAFTGIPRSAAARQAHESPRVMTTPLLILAVPSLLAGLWSIDLAYGRQFGSQEAAHSAGWLNQLFAPFSHAPVAAFASMAAVAFGLMLAWPLYSQARRDPLPDMLGWFARAMRNRFYFDEIYEKLIAWTQEALASLANGFDRWIIAGLFVRGTHGTTELFGRALRLLQTGNLQTYAFLFAFGVVILLLVFL